MGLVRSPITKSSSSRFHARISWYCRGLISRNSSTRRYRNRRQNFRTGSDARYRSPRASVRRSSKSMSPLLPHPLFIGPCRFSEPLGHGFRFSRSQDPFCLLLRYCLLKAPKNGASVPCPNDCLRQLLALQAVCQYGPYPLPLKAPDRWNGRFPSDPSRGAPGSAFGGVPSAPRLPGS